MTFDYCIVGSGIGGASILQALLKKGITNIVLVEAGNSSSSKAVNHTMSGRDFGLRTTRAIQLGGGSNLWHGVLSPLDPIDFKKNDNSLSGWPISYQEIQPFYHKASKLLGIKNYKNFNVQSLSGNIKLMLKDLQFNNQLFENKIFQQPIPVLSFNTKKQYSKITLKTDCVALELLHQGDGQASKLKIGLKNGVIEYISAKKYILCLGALETPRLLLNSHLKNENIGKYLMDHPMGNLFQIELDKKVKAPLYSDTKSDKNQKIKSGFILKDGKLLNYNHCFFLRPSFVKGINNKSEKLKLSLLAIKDGKIKYKDLLSIFKNINLVAQILLYKFTLNVNFKYLDVFVVSEQKPSENNRVSLSNSVDDWGYPIADIKWDVEGEYVKSVESLYDLMTTDFLQNVNYKMVHKRESIDWSQNLSSAAHHTGTCRMSSAASSGVVNSELQLFDLENVYICDGSVFPTCGNANPSLTISALAFRLADYLVKK